MKHSQSFILATLLSSILSVGGTAFAAGEATLETKGKVQRLLMNPEGEVDGLLLEDGTQVKFPPHMSKDLVSLVKAKDSVSVKGFRENGKVFKAESITNTASNKSVVEKAPTSPDGGPGEPGLKGPKGPKGPENRQGLKELTAQGKIQTQLFGRKGEVNGAVLADGSIVRFSPRVLEGTKVKLDVGQNIKVTGFGTQNEIGKSLEATNLTSN